MKLGVAMPDFSPFNFRASIIPPPGKFQRFSILAFKLFKK
jgi:hypothetical protein